MAALVTKVESAAYVRLREGKREIVEVYHVSGVSTKQDAEIAAGVPAYNESHPDFPTALVKDKQTSGKVNNFRIECSYSTPSGPSWPLNYLSPINRPFRVRIVPSVDRVEGDRTIDGKPVVNPVGDVFRPGVTKEIRVLVVEATGYFASPDAALAFWATYGGKVNKDAWSIQATGGKYSAAPGQAKCLLPTIDGEFDYGSTAAVPGTIRIEIREGKHPHQKRVISQGMRAWYTDRSGTFAKAMVGPIVSKKKGLDGLYPLVTEPIRLDADGKIAGDLVDSYGVGDNADDSIAGPFGASRAAKPFMDSETLNGVTFLYFRECDEVDFSVIIPTR